jgi:hypothetical protein
MLANSCSGIWIVKDETKSLETFIGVMKMLGMSVTLIQSNIVASHRTMKRPADMCMVEWSWGSKTKPFVCSSLKPASKT